MSWLGRTWTYDILINSQTLLTTELLAKKRNKWRCLRPVNTATYEKGSLWKIYQNNEQPIMITKTLLRVASIYAPILMLLCEQIWAYSPSTVNFLPNRTHLSMHRRKWSSAIFTHNHSDIFTKLQNYHYYLIFLYVKKKLKPVLGYSN